MRPKFLQGMVVSALFAVTGTARAQCDLIAVHNPHASIGTQPIEVRVGSLDSRWSTPFTPSFANRVFGFFARPQEAPDRVNDELAARVEAALAASLSDALGRPGSSQPGGQPSDTRLVLHADITGVSPGNRAARALGVGGRAYAAIRAVLTSADGRPFAAVVCDEISTYGGIFGAGGLPALAQSGESMLRGNLRKIAQSVAKQLGRTEQVAATLASRRRDKVDALELRNSSRVWLERPVERWSLKDAASVIGNFMANTHRVIGAPPVVLKGVHALWMTRPVHQAIRRSQALISEGEKSVWIHPFSLVLDEPVLRAIEDADAYTIAVWPWDKTPVYWNPDEIVSSTFVRRADRPDERIHPIGFVGPPWPPAIFLFPRTTSDSTPLVTSPDMTLELHSRLNGHQIVSRFELARFGLTDLAALDPGSKN